ncbi:MAG TPA: FAD:protein FMN transferase [Gaiellaceae bacterium]
MKSLAFRAMGCEVTVCGGTAGARRRAEALFRERDRRFSRFLAGSELNRVNAAGGPVILSADFARALEIALAAARTTGGRVTPTLGGPLLAAGYDRSSEELAPDPRPAARVPVRGHEALRLSGRMLDRPRDVVLDLNGVVKSLTVDDALELLGCDGWVAAGGDVACRGGVDLSLPGGGALRLEHGGLATSGVERRRWLRGGAWQHHLIDSRTGRPAELRWLEATVCAGSCIAADIAAKAALLADGDGRAWLERRRLAARLRARTGEIVETSRWRESLDESRAA